MKTITEDGEIIDTVTYEAVARTPPFFKTPWNHDTDIESHNTGQANNEPSKCQRQFQSDADINVILAKFMQTGELPLTGPPTYGDAEIRDLQDSIITRYQVEQAWNELPAAVRNILKDPKTFIDYVDHCMSTGDLEPLRELGLAAPLPTPPAPPEPPKAATGGTPAPEATKAPDPKGPAPT